MFSCPLTEGGVVILFSFFYSVIKLVHVNNNDRSFRDLNHRNKDKWDDININLYDDTTTTSDDNNRASYTLAPYRHPSVFWEQQCMYF